MMRICYLFKIANVLFPKWTSTISYKTLTCWIVFAILLPYIVMASYLELEFLPSPSNVTYTSGDLAILICAIQNLGNKFVSWRKTSDPSPLTVGTLVYSSDSRYHIRYIDYRGQWNLYIKNVQRTDAGLYECQVSTQARNMRKYVLLNVVEFSLLLTVVCQALTYPPVTTTPNMYNTNTDNIIFGPVSIDAGNELYVSCNVSTTGYQPDTFEINWFINGSIVDEDHKHINITKQLSDSHIQSTLSIRHASKEDSGEYICSTTSKQVGRQHIFVLNGEKSSSNTKRRTKETDKQQISSAASKGNDMAYSKHLVLSYLTFISFLIR